MRDYFIGLSAAAVICAVCAAFASGTALERYVRYMCSLVCLAAAVLPLVKAIPGALPEYDPPSEAAAAAEDAGKYFENAARVLTEEYIKTVSFEKTGIIPVGAGIEINRTDRETVVGGITVYVSKADSGRISELKAALERELGGRIDVEVADGAACE